MKLAILLVGGYRSFDRVASSIRTHLLSPNPGCKVFVYCETSLSSEELRVKMAEKLGEEVLGKVVAVPDSKSAEYLSIRDHLLRTQPALHPEVFARASQLDPFTWDQSYLINSGSIIQYYQLQKCIDLMLDYEREVASQFDLVIKSRMDLCLGVSIPIRNFFTELPSLEMNSELYLRSLGLEALAEQVQKPGEPNITRCYNFRPYRPSSEPVNPKLLKKIQTQPILWALGVEQLYLGRREIFLQLRSMVYHYGAYLNPNHHCTFNSESFFVYHLRRLGIQHLMIYPEDLQIYSQDPAQVKFFSLIR